MPHRISSGQSAGNGKRFPLQKKKHEASAPTAPFGRIYQRATAPQHPSCKLALIGALFRVKNEVALESN